MIGDWIDKVTYPQLPAMNDEELESFFDSTTFARLGTLNEDGSIHLAPIFFKVMCRWEPKLLPVSLANPITVPA